MFRKRGRLIVIAVLISSSGLLTIQSARASGYGLRESTSGTAFANAFAGATAGGEDISYMFSNPAGLTRHSGRQALAGADLIVPEARFKDGSSTTTLGGSITGNEGFDAGADAVAPRLYAMWPTDTRTRIGLGVTVPWGLETDHEDGWIGRYHGLQTKLVAINLNPVVARRVTSNLSVGAGVQVQYVRGKLSNAIDFGTLGSSLSVPGSSPTNQDGKVEMEADDWGLGFNLGLLYEPVSGTRFGLAYRSMVSHELDGDADFTLDDAGIGAAISASAGNFVDSGVTAKLATPEIISAGVWHEIDSRWTVMAEVAWTAWSRFQELRVTFDNDAQDDDVTVARWRDSWFVGAGATYRHSDAWTFRGGIAFDQSPVPDSTRNVRIPDEDRLWTAFGASYHGLKGVRLDIGYVHFFMDDATVNLTTDQEGNTFRGNLSGSFEVTSDLFSVQAVFSF